MNLQNATVPVAAVVGLVLAGLGWWVNAQERAVEAVEARQEAMAVEQADLKTQNSLLKQLVEQQAALIQQAAEDAKANRETLIRVESKLDAL